MTASSTPHAVERSALYADMSPHHLTPLWEVLQALGRRIHNRPACQHFGATMMFALS